MFDYIMFIFLLQVKLLYLIDFKYMYEHLVTVFYCTSYKYGACLYSFT